MLFIILFIESWSRWFRRLSCNMPHPSAICWPLSIPQAARKARDSGGGSSSSFKRECTRGEASSHRSTTTKALGSETPKLVPGRRDGWHKWRLRCRELLEMVMVKCSSFHHYAVQCHCNAFSCKASRSPPPKNTKSKNWTPRRKCENCSDFSLQTYREFF